jgi:hypothetical protein
MIKVIYWKIGFVLIVVKNFQSEKDGPHVEIKMEGRFLSTFCLVSLDSFILLFYQPPYAGNGIPVPNLFLVNRGSLLVPT